MTTSVLLKKDITSKQNNFENLEKHFFLKPPPIPLIYIYIQAYVYHDILLGGFHPIEKYYIVTLDFFPKIGFKV